MFVAYIEMNYYLNLTNSQWDLKFAYVIKCGALICFVWV